MRRDNFTVAVRRPHADGAGEPTIEIGYDGPEETLTSQLTDSGGDAFGAEDIDAAFRLRGDVDADDATGVLSLTHRITGEYLLEANADASAVLDLVGAVRERAEDDGSYGIRVERADGDPLGYEMDALLVYDADGELLRKHSLIPSGVEL